MLNELKARPGEHAFQRLDGLLEPLAPLLRAPDAAALFVEPGTRLGGKTIIALRDAAREFDLTPLGPCTHDGECPLQDGRTWCHFTFGAEGAPRWLTDLSHEAHLEKTALSLSFVLLGNAEAQQKFQPAPSAARIVSAPFRVPGIPGMARYACTGRGLALLKRAEALPSGAEVTVRWPETPPQDRKSGAWILEHAERVAPVERPAMPSPFAPTTNKEREGRAPGGKPAPRPRTAPGKAPRPQGQGDAPKHREERRDAPKPEVRRDAPKPGDRRDAPKHPQGNKDSRPQSERRSKDDARTKRDGDSPKSRPPRNSKRTPKPTGAKRGPKK